MTDIPIVSILITVYNRENFLAESIESVLASTYQNWELIIVDDCSIDNSFQIAKSYETKDLRIKVYRNEVNLGQFQNRNKAASYAIGKYIKYLDSDDIIYPNGLKIMVEAMEQYPDAGLGIPNTSNNPKLKYPFKRTSCEAYWEHFSGDNYLNHGPSASIFKKEIFDLIGGFDYEIGILTDSYLNLRLAAASTVVLFQRDLFYWRIHADQVTIEQNNFSKMAIERYNIIVKALSAKECPLEYKQKEQIFGSFRRIYCHHVIRHILLSKFSGAIKIYKFAHLSIFDIAKSIIPRKIFSNVKYKNEYS